MINIAINKLKTKKYIIQGLLFSIFFLVIYLILDYLNYRETVSKPSLILIVINIVINLLMAFLGAILMNLSTIMMELKTKGDGGANLGFVSIILGIFTYGCTSCVVTFLAAVGISFSPAIFPFIYVLNGLLYKFLSLGLIVLGLYLVVRNINKGVCKIKY